MEPFDWNLVRSFVAVGQSGSLSAAARSLGLSQPTIGRHVDELEKALGQVLFRRGKRGYELTVAGAALMQRGEAAVDAMAALSRRAAGQETSLSGTVRVAASEIVSAFVLPAIIARLGEAEPGIEVEIVASDRVENLLRRDADIAIRMVRPTQQDLVARKIADIPLGLCAAHSYLDQRGRPNGLEDLLSHDLVGFDRSDLILNGLAAYGMRLARDRFRMRTDSQIVYWQSVCAGNGIGFGQAPLIARTPVVEALLPEIKPPPLPMWLTMHSDVRSNPRIRRAADFLGEALVQYAAIR
jgi:DNA-binding transcriptional LysR family regulator